MFYNCWKELRLAHFYILPHYNIYETKVLFCLAKGSKLWKNGPQYCTLWTTLCLCDRKHWTSAWPRNRHNSTQPRWRKSQTHTHRSSPAIHTRSSNHSRSQSLRTVSRLVHRRCNKRTLSSFQLKFMLKYNIKNWTIIYWKRFLINCRISVICIFDT